MSRKQTPLRPYFEKMADIGTPLSDADIVKAAVQMQQGCAAGLRNSKISGGCADIADHMECDVEVHGDDWARG